MSEPTTMLTKLITAQQRRKQTSRPASHSVVHPTLTSGVSSPSNLRDGFCFWDRRWSRHKRTMTTTHTMIFSPNCHWKLESWICSFKFLRIMNSPGTFTQHDLLSKQALSTFTPHHLTAFRKLVQSSLKLHPEATIWKNLHRCFYCQVSLHIRGICCSLYDSKLNMNIKLVCAQQIKEYTRKQDVASDGDVSLDICWSNCSFCSRCCSGDKLLVGVDGRGKFVHPDVLNFNRAAGDECTASELELMCFFGGGWRVSPEAMFQFFKHSSFFFFWSKRGEKKKTTFTQDVSQKKILWSYSWTRQIWVD